MAGRIVSLTPQHDGDTWAVVCFDEGDRHVACSIASLELPAIPQEAGAH